MIVGAAESAAGSLSHQFSFGGCTDYVRGVRPSSSRSSRPMFPVGEVVPSAALVRPLAPTAFSLVVTTLAPLVAAINALTHQTRGRVSPKGEVDLAA